MALDPNNPVGQMRLLTGDYIEDEPYLEDNIYLWFYQQNGNSVIDGAIEALESIINNIALSPAKWRIDGAYETQQSIGSLESRLLDLKARRRKNKAPVVINADRKNWDDLNNLFHSH